MIKENKNNNNNSKAIEKINLNELLNEFRISNIKNFHEYLTEIWNDLTQRSSKKNSGIEKLTFSSYYELPGIISERLFSVFDRDNSGLIEHIEFLYGMTVLFSDNESFNSLAKFIFKFYDFNKKEKITKEDVRVVLSYVPLQNNKKSNNLGGNINNFEDRVESQEDLYDILNKTFGEKSELNFKEYLNIIENVNSDIFLLILVFLLEKKPFDKEVLNIYNYSLNEEIGPLTKSLPPKSPNMKYKTIVSPCLDSKFVSTQLKRRTLAQNIFNAKNNNKSNILSLYAGIINEKDKEQTKSINKTDIKEKNKELYKININEIKKINDNFINRINNEKENIAKKNSFNDIIENNNSIPETETEIKATNKPQRRARINLNNLIDKSPELTKEANQIFDEEINYNEDSEEIKKPLIKYEGYIYKISADKKLHKIYFRLIGKDLYYFKGKNDPKHKGMHNLSGIYTKKGEEIVYEKKKYFSLCVAFPQKERIYYFENEESRNKWLEKLKIVTEYKCLTDKYIVKEKIGKGKFGLVKLGKNKENGELVAIKIISKKKMDSSDLELAKTEIDILKISQHPNIIKLYDVFDTINHIYIVMEYCSGGDLFSYIENTDYKLPEPRACEIIHKLSMAVYYLHSYGIIHRDLKPENILMTNNEKNSDIRLLDFGLSKLIGPNEKCVESYGTLSFAAPEILRGVSYDKSVDIWSIGIITYLLLTGFLPFDDKHSEKEIARQIIQDPVPYPSKIWNKISIEGKKFVDNLLRKNSKERLNIKELLEHPWIKKYIKDINIDEIKPGSEFAAYTMISNNK